MSFGDSWLFLASSSSPSSPAAGRRYDRILLFFPAPPRRCNNRCMSGCRTLGCPSWTPGYLCLSSASSSSSSSFFRSHFGSSHFGSSNTSVEAAGQDSFARQRRKPRTASDARLSCISLLTSPAGAIEVSSLTVFLQYLTQRFELLQLLRCLLVLRSTPSQRTGLSLGVLRGRRSPSLRMSPDLLNGTP